MLLTYSDNGYSRAPWAAPFVLFSLPLLFASLGLRLALPALKQLPPGSGSRSAAAVALCICGVVFALALGPALDLLGVF
jgi:Kef-type K+ transport system membrane component KefB